MGCCGSKEKGWTERHDVVLDFMRGDGYLKTVWTTFKINVNAHSCMEYDEFCALLFISLEIYDKIQMGTSRQLSSQLSMNETVDIELKYKRKHAPNRDHLGEMSRSELNDRSNMEQLQQTLDEIAPKLAVQFDKDGDGVFSWDEFKELGVYLVNEYKKITSGYQPPSNDESMEAGLLQRT